MTTQPNNLVPTPEPDEGAPLEPWMLELATEAVNEVHGRSRHRLNTRSSQRSSGGNAAVSSASSCVGAAASPPARRGRGGR